MYTGIIESTGTILAVNQYESGSRIHVSADTTNIASEDSIGVNGVCVTAESITPDGFKAFLSDETVSRTYLSELAPGTQVNIEHPLSAHGRFDGHMVKGTVDTVSKITNITQRGEDWQFTFSIPEGYEQYLVEKGAVALDGISLTISDVATETFSVAVVPKTYALTTLSAKAVGDQVHFEADILAKYVERQCKVHS